MSKQGTSLGKVTGTENECTLTPQSHGITQWFDSGWNRSLPCSSLWVTSGQVCGRQHMDVHLSGFLWQSCHPLQKTIMPSRKGDKMQLLYSYSFGPLQGLIDGILGWSTACLEIQLEREGFPFLGGSVSVVTEWRFTWYHQYTEHCARTWKVLWDIVVHWWPGWRSLEGELALWEPWWRSCRALQR